MDKSICNRCQKTLHLCVCKSIKPVRTKLHTLILQHPQEPDKYLGSAQLAHLSLPNSTLKIGLSWRNLSAALGKEVVPSRWIVLHLGSGIKKPLKTATARGALILVNKKGEAVEEVNPVTGGLFDGIVLLDGTWSQAKTLWWRNAWLLKLRRGILIPSEPSLYKELRKEPRRECLSTIETAAQTLTLMGESSEVSTSLKNTFSELLNHYRENKPDRSKKKKPETPETTE